MAPIAIVFGALLTLLGSGIFVYLDMNVEKITALIPAFFGIPLIVLGALAFNDSLRKHVMHGAAVIGLVGFAVPTYMVVKGLATGGEFDLAKQEQAAMAVLCAVFLGLCVKSFIDARKARKLKEAESAGA